MTAPNPPRPPSTASTSTAAATTTSKAAQPPTPLTIAPTAIVADKAILTGAHRITIQDHATIHPFARLDSSAGELHIGEACAVWEKAVIGGGGVSDLSDINRNHSKGKDATAMATADENPSTAGPAKKTTIGPYSTISPHASVGASSAIGEHSTVDVGASVGANCTIGAYCRLAPMTSLEAGEMLDDYTVLFFVDGEQRRRVNVSLKEFGWARELEGKAREKERELVGRIVKASAAVGKWR